MNPNPLLKTLSSYPENRKFIAQTNMVFSGSFVVSGSAKILVTATGNDTEYGRIASLSNAAKSESPIQQKTSKLISRIAAVVIIIAVTALIIQLAQGVAFLSALEFTLAIIVSAVPEGLPIAISVVLALGASRMAKKNALVKELRAIESIGVITTIASDKTGTFTENQLSIKEIWSPNKSTNIIKAIASSALPEGISTDPLDLSIIRYLRNQGQTDLIPNQSPSIDPVRNYPFDTNLKMSGNLYQNNKLVVKGAPETILSRCQLSEPDKQKTEAAIITPDANPKKHFCSLPLIWF